MMYKYNLKKGMTGQFIDKILFIRSMTEFIARNIYNLT